MIFHISLFFFSYVFGPAAEKRALRIYADGEVADQPIQYRDLVEDLLVEETCLFKYTENFIAKKNVQIKKNIFHVSALNRWWVLVRTVLTRRF